MVRGKSPAELEIDLFCLGLRVDGSCRLETEGRQVSRTRAGLGSGLELVIPGDLKDVWVNAPVEEDFAAASPLRLCRDEGGAYRIEDERDGTAFPVRVPPEPAWYTRTTARGTPMHRVGVLQGTYLGIYVSNACMYWYRETPENCKFCTTGYNVGVNEVAEKDVEDVVETALAARRESGVTFVHLNTGYQNGRGLDQCAPFVKALKERVGVLVGVQCVPPPPSDQWKYDWLLDLGTDHFSFCFEFWNPGYFARFLPGKQATVGQKAFFEALEYCQRKMPRGACSGEIIAGVEPVEDTIAAIDWITDAGAFPTVCIFRPVIGSDMEDHPPPKSADMVRVMRHMYEACRRARIPIGVAPNIEVSLIVNPDDARYLVPRDLRFRLYEWRLAILRRLARWKFARELRPHPVRGVADPKIAAPRRAAAV